MDRIIRQSTKSRKGTKLTDDKINGNVCQKKNSQFKSYYDKGGEFILHCKCQLYFHGNKAIRTYYFR